MSNSIGKRAAMVALFCFLSVPWIHGQEPGTVADPLVTKSYLDQFFRFRSVVIPAGEKNKLVPGSLLVLRSGRVKVRTPQDKGLVDLTDGRELSPDSFLPPNHLILVPDSADYFLESQTPSLILVVGMFSRK